MPAKISGSGKGGQDSLADLITCGFIGFAAISLGTIIVGNLTSGYLNRKSLEEETRRHQAARGHDSRAQAVQHPTSSRYGHVSNAEPAQSMRSMYFLIPGRFTGKELEPTSHWYAFDNDGDGKVDELIIWRNMDRRLITDLDLVRDAVRTPQGRSIEHYMANDAKKYICKTAETRELSDERRKHVEYLLAIAGGKQ